MYQIGRSASRGNVTFVYNPLLSTSPIIQRHDQTQFGRYGTEDRILAYMNALASGDTESRMAL